MDSALPQPSPSLVDRLCALLVAERGYGPPVPELATLASAFDRVFVRSDGFVFEVICLLDRTTDPGRRTAVTLDRLREAGEACLKYTGTVSGQKMPVSIEVWEVCGAAAHDTTHLAGLSRLGIRDKVGIACWALRVDDGSVWTNAKHLARFFVRRRLAGLLARARAGEAPVTATPELPTGPPLLTWTLAAALAAVFAWQLATGEHTGLLSLTAGSLVEQGGIAGALVAEGEWYRLCSGVLLHGGALHLLMNGVALVLGGTMLERIVGRAWTFTAFGSSALAGAVASLAVNPPTIVSVGASGGIMGMLALALAVTARLPHGRDRTAAQIGLVQWLVPALLPLAVNRSGDRIDFAAHLGGALAGGLLGALLLRAWTPGSARAPGARLAVGLALSFAVALAAGLGLAVSR